MNSVDPAEEATPPGRFPAARGSRQGGTSAFNGIGALSLLSLFRYDAQAHLFANRAGEEAPDGVGLPASGLHQFRERSPLRPLQQIQHFGGFAAIPGPFGRHSRLGGLWLFGPLLG